MDMLSYIIGLVKGKEDGKGVIEFQDGQYTIEDEGNDGHLVIKEAEDDG